MRGFFFILALTPGLAAADAARVDQGLDEGCFAIDTWPLSIPVHMAERHYWTYDQAPSSHDFELIRDDTQIFLSVGDRVSCFIVDPFAPATAETIEAALERKFSGAWSRSGDVWMVDGARPLTVRLTNTERGAGIAVETGS
ncbi:hypothetical protein G5B40_16130 [Pikeienuella piscinae]|uniref:Uncharacterized protein n=1 Tax=Pikeienuella piscinae TaxID=2748098 RepID=A0A7L5BWQ5_9RHOB|nr:hypothetical protein [Pikeienuella piscinae]QIE56830.1 hypothetical protein G5B40_16130 [Pikeienuella piscinae]